MLLGIKRSVFLALPLVSRTPPSKRFLRCRRGGAIFEPRQSIRIGFRIELP